MPGQDHADHGRHGNRVTAVRVHRQADRVIAFLDDGSTDGAPTTFSHGLGMPGAARSAVRDARKAVATACIMGSLA